MSEFSRFFTRQVGGYATMILHDIQYAGTAVIGNVFSGTWSGLSNISVDDGVCAVATLGYAQLADEILAMNFGTVIKANDEVLGFQFEVKASGYVPPNDADNIGWDTMRIVLNGTTQPSMSFPRNDAYFAGTFFKTWVFGEQSNLSGFDLTAADFANNLFGLSLIFTNESNPGTAIISLDYVKRTVWYKHVINKNE